MSDARALVLWALATFHTTLFVLALVVLLYSRGSFGATLASLNTLVGLGLFLALWITTYFTTRRALDDQDLLAETFDRPLFGRRVVRYGAVNALAFLLVLAVVLIVGSMAATPRGGNPFGVLGLALIASPFAVSVALVVGGIVGVTLGAVDLLLLSVARALVRG
jgi:hypothetical protein